MCYPTCCPLSPNQVLTRTHAAKGAARHAKGPGQGNCPLVRFSHIGSIKDAARDGPCAHGKIVWF